MSGDDESLFPPRPEVPQEGKSTGDDPVTGAAREMPIDEIKIGERFRKDMGDLDALADSIKNIGLLQPVVVRRDGSLVAGARRIAAFQQLGRTSIPVTIVDIDNILRGEFDENDKRKNWTPSEKAKIKRALEPDVKAEAKKRQREGGRSKAPGKIPEAAKGEAADKIAGWLGMDRKTLKKAEAVVEAAERDPEKYGPALERMDATGNISAAYRQVVPELSPQVSSALHDLVKEKQAGTGAALIAAILAIEQFDLDEVFRRVNLEHLDEVHKGHEVWNAKLGQRIAEALGKVPEPAVATRDEPYPPVGKQISSILIRRRGAEVAKLFINPGASSRLAVLSDEIWELLLLSVDNGFVPENDYCPSSNDGRVTLRLLFPGIKTNRRGWFSRFDLSHPDRLKEAREVIMPLAIANQAVVRKHPDKLEDLCRRHRKTLQTDVTHLKWENCGRTSPGWGSKCVERASLLPLTRGADVWLLRIAGTVLSQPLDRFK